jgi:mannose-6-phosphate isomerase-like protein (cupin superfamily)
MLPDVDAFSRDGFLGAVPIFNPSECADLFRLVTSSGRGKPIEWTKGHAATHPSFYNAAADLRLINLVKPIIGPNVILWGARTVTKKVGDVHAFHTDIEASSPTGRFASIWIGLNNTSRQSGLKFVRGSHLFGKAVQQLENETGLQNVGDETILEWAKQFTPNPELVQPDVADGLALVFDGRVWHGSHNATGTFARTALLVQYASADQSVFIPEGFDTWPPAFDRQRRPPVIVVTGSPTPEINRVVDPPLVHRYDKLANSIHRLESNPSAEQKPFVSVRHFEGETEVLDYIESHTSVLAPGATPHPLHWHEEEEYLVVVSGEASLHIADNAEGKNETVEVMRPGDFIYYPAFRHHTLINTGSSPLLYTMLKWRNHSPKTNFDPSPQAQVFRTGEEVLKTTSDTRYYRKLFDERTHWLHKAHAHVSIMPPGHGYKAHEDAHDVCIVLLSGTVETLGSQVTAPAVLFHPSGESHGLACIGDTPARYIVFEFHGDSRKLVRQTMAVAKKPKKPKKKEKRRRGLRGLLQRLFAKLKRTA